MKYTSSPRQQTENAGFTLIEIITVIAIIMALAAMTIGGFRFATVKAQSSRTTVLLGSLSQSLEDYRADQGFFPQGDGGKGSTEQVYIALYGDGELEYDIDTEKVVVRVKPDGESDQGVNVYLSTLDPSLLGKSQNARKDGSTYVIVDAWKMLSDQTKRQELFYRHDPAGMDSQMMNPPSEFDLWSLGPDGEGGPEGSAGSSGGKKERSDDIKNW